MIVEFITRFWAKILLSRSFNQFMKSLISKVTKISSSLAKTQPKPPSD